MRNKLQFANFLVSFLFITVCLSAQAPDTAWMKVFGDPFLADAQSVQQTTDGGYVIAGSATSLDLYSEDVWLLKTDSLGDTLWTKKVGGSANDNGYSVWQTTDGGYIVTGYTYSYGAGDRDVYLIKTNSEGDTLWTKAIGGVGDDRGHSVQQTTDGGYIIAGLTTSYGAGSWDFYLVKTDSLGDTLWTRAFGGGDYDRGESVQQANDGGYIVAGYTASYGAGSNDVYLVKTDSLGDTLWTRAIGGSVADDGYSVRQTTDNGYIITGFTWSGSAGGTNIYLVKTDSLGDTLWTRTFGGDGGEQGQSVRQTTDGGYIVAGFTTSYGAGSNYIYLIKTDSLGDTLWTKTVGDSSGYVAYSVQQTTDGGYIVTGPGASGLGLGVFLVKIKPEGSGVEEDIIMEGFSITPAAPNPFTIETTLSYKLLKSANVDISVYNMLGQKIKELYSGVKSAGVHNETWNGTAISGEIVPCGIYFLNVKIGGKEASSKVLFLR